MKVKLLGLAKYKLGVGGGDGLDLLRVRRGVGAHPHQQDIRLIRFAPYDMLCLMYII